jgi:hypothetical protein
MDAMLMVSREATGEGLSNDSMRGAFMVVNDDGEGECVWGVCATYIHLYFYTSGGSDCRVCC